MPPHCATLDGPVVTAARQSLERDDVDLALPVVPLDGEDEVRAGFDLARKARSQGDAARVVADLFFFDTVVRVHRRGEGAPHSGLKPVGLDVGPVIPVAERALETGDTDELVALLGGELEQQVRHRLGHARELAADAGQGVAAAREAATAALGLLVWSNRLFESMRAQPHEDGHGH